MTSPDPRSSPPLPDFLVIGAMKAGTTTLYHDLRALPGLFLPEKESNAFLAPDPVDTLAHRFPATKVGSHLAGEVCPDYTKPVLDARAARAAADLYREADRSPRLVYLVRDPISRILSHHHFLSSQHGEANPRNMTRDIESALRDFPELLGTSRYHERLQPWIDAFAREALLVVRFEDYITDRGGVLESVGDFLGLPEVDTSAIRADAVHNASEARPVATPGWRRVMRSSIYRRVLRPLLPLGLRNRIRHRLLPGAPPRPAPPSEATRRRLVEALRPDVAALAELMELEGLPWDLEKTPDSRHG